MNITVHSDYLPTEEPQRVIWLNEFNSKLPGYMGIIMGLTAPDLASVAADAPFYQYVIGLISPAKNYAQAIVDYKDMLTYAPQTAGIPLLPAFAPAAPSAPVPPGIFTRISMLVDRIKGDAGYTTSIGTNLRVIGAQSVVDADTLKPDLSGKIVTGFPMLHAHKHHTDGFNLYCDYSDGHGLIKITNVSTRTGYHDTTPLPAATNVQIRTYVAIHTLNDKEVGQASDPVKLTVTTVI